MHNQLDNEMEVVHTFPKNIHEEVWAYLQNFRDHRLAHVRVFAADSEDRLHPTPRGIAVRVDDLDHLEEAVSNLRRATDAVGEAR